MTESFTKWDVTEHLHTQEDVYLYLEACAEEDPGDGSLICAALNDIARAGNMTEKGKSCDSALAGSAPAKRCSQDDTGLP